jgi:hypothetical protein
VLERKPYTIVEGCYENAKVETLKVRSLSLINRREMSAYLLFEMQDQPEDWELDLLSCTLSSLDYAELLSNE